MASRESVESLAAVMARMDAASQQIPKFMIKDGAILELGEEERGALSYLQRNSAVHAPTPAPATLAPAAPEVGACTNAPDVGEALAQHIAANAAPASPPCDSSPAHAQAHAHAPAPAPAPTATTAAAAAIATVAACAVTLPTPVLLAPASEPVSGLASPVPPCERPLVDADGEPLEPADIEAELQELAEEEKEALMFVPSLDTETQLQRNVIATCLRRHVGKRDEEAILAVMVDAKDINGLLQTVQLKVLVGSIRDHHVRTGPNRTRLLELLLSKVSVLVVKTKVLVIAAYCRRGKRDLAEQRLLLDLFLSTTGADFYELKHSLDNHAHDTVLSVILDEYLTSPDIRDAFLDHVDREAARLAGDPTFTPHVHALSDIDDTFVHSGLGLGGPKYPVGSVLPGVITLFSHLKAHVVFVTARPAAFRRRTFFSLRNLLRADQRSVTVLTGKLRDSILIPFNVGLANEKIAARKLSNFRSHARVFPECRFVWFGDSGQSDVEVGVRMMENANVLGAYIQDVARPDGCILATASMQRQRQLDRRVYIADNYVDVALQMHSAHLLTRASLHATALDATIQLLALRPRFPHPDVFLARAREMRVHLDRVNKLLARDPAFSPVNLPSEIVRLL